MHHTQPTRFGNIFSLRPGHKLHFTWRPWREVIPDVEKSSFQKNPGRGWEAQPGVVWLVVGRVGVKDVDFCLFKVSFF